MDQINYTSNELLSYEMLKQKSISFFRPYILYKRLVTFLKTSFTLQLFFLLIFAIFFVFAGRVYSLEKGIISMDLILSVYLFSLLVTTQLDAYSRYQNYKMVKDMLYKNGFRGLIVKPFSKSQCQREAVKEAACQLNMDKQVKKYFYDSGYRWYHIIPTVLLENPLLFFTKGYWITTFFVPNYRSKYFIW